MEYFGILCLKVAGCGGWALSGFGGGFCGGGCYVGAFPIISVLYWNGLLSEASPSTLSISSLK